ncbi:MAG: hypothetical protein V1929_13055 [bacterium]
MEEAEREQLKRWVECWKRAGPELEEIRRRELRAVSTPQAMLNLSDLFESAHRHFSLKPMSGLVEQQSLFRKLHP